MKSSSGTVEDKQFLANHPSNDTFGRTLTIYPYSKLCSNCHAALEKIFCITCKAGFCEQCFISMHIVQFSHSSIFSLHWPGYHHTCTSYRNSHCYFYCLECRMVVEFFFYLTFVIIYLYHSDRLCALCVPLLSIIRVIDLILIITFSQCFLNSLLHLQIRF